MSMNIKYTQPWKLKGRLGKDGIHMCVKSLRITVAVQPFHLSATQIPMFGLYIKQGSEVDVFFCNHFLT